VPQRTEHAAPTGRIAFKITISDSRRAHECPCEAAPPKVEQDVKAHTRQRPTGRKPLPEKLPRVDIEILPPEAQREGLDAFERMGEDVSESVERRPASLVVVRIHKPKFVPKGRDRFAETQVFQAPAGPALLADTVVRRWQDHLPLHRLERIYDREGLELARSTVCGWHEELATRLQAARDGDVEGCPGLALPVYRCDGCSRPGERAMSPRSLLGSRRARAARPFWLLAAPRLGRGG
jgi:transposase